MKKQVSIIALSILSMALNADGTLDTTFGNGSGYMTTPATFSALGVGVQTDGKIVVGGSDPNNSFQLVRYNINGSIDTSFGGSGTGISGGFGEPIGTLSDILVQSNDYIVAGGQDVNGNFQLAQFYPEGYINSFFGNNGIVVGPSGFCTALAQQQDGFILAAGSDANGKFSVVRYDTIGNINTIFQEGPAGYVEDIIVQPLDGKIVVCGTTNTANFCVVRYNTNGTLDTSFGVNGVATGPQGVATSLVIQTNGAIVVAGFNLNSPNNMLLTRFTTSGTIDTLFGLDGLLTGPAGIINDMLLESDGKFIVAGVNGANSFMARFNTLGIIDITFGIAGETISSLGLFERLAFQQNGNIIVAGLDTTYSNFLIARYKNSQPLIATQMNGPVVAAVGSVTMQGTAQNPSDVFIFLNDQFLGSVPTASNGNNTWSYTTALANPGLYTVRAVAQYTGGNVTIAGAANLRVHA